MLEQRPERLMKRFEAIKKSIQESGEEVQGVWVHDLTGAADVAAQRIVVFGVDRENGRRLAHTASEDWVKTESSERHSFPALQFLGSCSNLRLKTSVVRGPREAWLQPPPASLIGRL